MRISIFRIIAATCAVALSAAVWAQPGKTAVQAYPAKPIRVIVNAAAGGSTDVADVSWVVPTTGLRAATWVPGTSSHSWQAIAAGGTSIGSKGMFVAARTLALTAIDLFTTPKLIAEARAEYERRVGPGFKYVPLVGDRPPPLDYRNKPQ